MAESKSGSTVAPRTTVAGQGDPCGEEGGEGPQEASNDPADMGRMRQIKRAYQVTHEHDRACPAAGRVPAAAGRRGHHRSADQVLNLIFVGLGVAVLLPMIVLVRQAKAATYKRYAGQAGSAEVALSMLPKKWISSPSSRPTRARTWCTARSVPAAWS